jgi:hypothetical protein
MNVSAPFVTQFGSSGISQVGHVRQHRRRPLVVRVRWAAAIAVAYRPRSIISSAFCVCNRFSA